MGRAPAALVTALAAALALGCGDEPPAAPTGTGERWTGTLAPARPGEEVVALVDELPIYASDLARHARARGLAPVAALDELVTAELLAREALRRGYADHPEVAEVRQREAVRRLLELDFERAFDGPEDIPTEEIDRIWGQPDVQRFYNHERLHDVAFVRVPVRKDATPDEDAAARAHADAIHRRAVAARPADEEAFRVLADAVAEERGVALQHDRFTTGPKGPAVPAFAAAAFTIDERGEIAAPARTRWGWDVLYLLEVIPERRTPRAEAEKEIRQHRFEPARRAAFLRWVDGLVAQARVVRHDERLAAVEIRPPEEGP